MMKGQVSIEMLMMAAVSVLILSLLLTQIKAIEKMGEKAIKLKQEHEANETINSLCKLAALTNSRQEIELSFMKNFSLNVSNSFCKKEKIEFKKGRNKLIFSPGKKIKLSVKLVQLKPANSSY